MAERIEDPEGGVEAGVEPVSPAAAIAIGVGKGRSRERPDPEFDAFLRDQRRLIDLQMEHLHEQRELQLAHLRVRRWKDRMSLALQVLGVIVGAAIVVALGVMVWQAHEDHGLVIEAFSVPPDLAAKGLTGEVVAGQLLDNLSDMQGETNSSRPARSYQNNWGDDLKLEIPETGVSLSELNRWLRRWLGSQTRVTGEVHRTAGGLTVSVRAGQDGGASFSGPEADLDMLMQRAAETVYRRTQPYRYGIWLLTHGHEADALPILTALANGPDGEDRLWAEGMVASSLYANGDLAGGVGLLENAVHRHPRALTWGNVANAMDALDREEPALDAYQRAGRALRAGDAEYVPNARRVTALVQEEIVAELRGDFQKSLALDEETVESPDFSGSSTRAWQIYDAAMDHDAATSDAAAASAPAPRYLALLETGEADAALGRWREALATAAAVQAVDPKSLSLLDRAAFVVRTRRDFAAWHAWAKAMSGDLADAKAMIAATPLDCDTCLLMRGRIATAERDFPAAERWFGQATRQAPSIPFAYTDWGAERLARGDVEGAIGKWQFAHAKSPKFADPLELWGEALMAKHDYAGAVAKFAEADKDAPRWGRNHMQWGEALMLSGRYAEARAQYETAKGMDLSKPDRAALTVLLARTASGRLHG
jgi:tetratricopeptide (TPR) repeat protein